MSDENPDFEIAASNNPIKVDYEALEPNSSEKQTEREELSKQIEAFLASGGKISHIEPNVLADPPKKPSSNYGSQPI